MAGEARRADLLSLVLMVGFATASLTLSMIAVIAPRLESGRGLTASQIGLLVSAFLFTYGAAQIPAGAAASRWGGCVLSAAYGLMLVGSLLLAVAGSFSVLLLARLIQGLGAGLVLPSSGVIMAARVPAKRLARAWGIFGAGWGVGAIAALLILPIVVSKGGVPAAASVTAALVAAAALVALSRGALTTRPAVAPVAGRLWVGLRTVAGTPSVHLLGLLNAAAIAVGVGALAWTPSFLADKHGANLAVAAYLTAGLGAAQIVASPFGAGLAARVGSSRTLAAAFVGMLAMAAGVPFLPGAATVFIAIVLLGFFSTMYFAPTFAQIPAVVDSRLVGQANGFVNAEGFFGSLMAPFVFGLFVDSGGGYTAGYLFLAACGLVGLIVVVLIASSRSRASAR